VRRYATRAEAVAREVISPIEAGGADVAIADQFDIDGIAAEVLGGWEDGYVCLVEPAEFWSIVAEHARMSRPRLSDR